MWSSTFICSALLSPATAPRSPPSDLHHPCWVNHTCFLDNARHIGAHLRSGALLPPAAVHPVTRRSTIVHERHRMSPIALPLSPTFPLDDEGESLAHKHAQQTHTRHPPRISLPLRVHSSESTLSPLRPLADGNAHVTTTILGFETSPRGVP